MVAMVSSELVDSSVVQLHVDFSLVVKGVEGLDLLSQNFMLVVATGSSSCCSMESSSALLPGSFINEVGVRTLNGGGCFQQQEQEQ